jgi:hypothetical protein
MNAAHFTLWNILVSSTPDAHAGHTQHLRKHRTEKAFRKIRSFSKLWFRWTARGFESPMFLSRKRCWKFKIDSTVYVTQFMTNIHFKL